MLAAGSLKLSFPVHFKDKEHEVDKVFMPPEQIWHEQKKVLHYLDDEPSIKLDVWQAALCLMVLHTQCDMKELYT